MSARLRKHTIMKYAQRGFFVLVSSFEQICFLLESLQIYSFLSGFPTHLRTTQYKQTNKQTFSHLLLRPSKHYSLTTNIQEQTKQNCRPHLAKLQCCHIHYTLATVLPHSLHLRHQMFSINNKIESTKNLMLGAGHMGC